MKTLIMTRPAVLVSAISFLVFYSSMLIGRVFRFKRGKFQKGVARFYAPLLLPLSLSILNCITGVSANLEIALAASSALVVCQLGAIRSWERQAFLSVLSVLPVLLYGLGLGNFVCPGLMAVVLAIGITRHRALLGRIKFLTQQFTAQEMIGEGIISVSISVLLLFAAAGSVAAFLPGVLSELIDISMAVPLAAGFAVQYIRFCSGRDLHPGRRHMSRLEAASREFQEQELLNGPDTCLRTIYCRFLNLMEEKELFLDPQMTVVDAARMLFTNRNYLGKAISLYSGRNYCSMVNSYRIRYAVDAFTKNPYLRIGQLVEMSGFRTPGAFTLAFRLEMKKSPSEWCAEYRESHTK